MNSALKISIVSLIFTNYVLGCDEARWNEVSKDVNKCMDNTLVKFHSLSRCEIATETLKCLGGLKVCQKSHSFEIEKIYTEVVNLGMQKNLETCLHRTKRAARKRGGGGLKGAGKRLFGGSRSNPARTVSSSSSKVRGGGHKKLKKFGKYAVAGLAAYGTYKLAKKMTKGLRGSYDDDDCWEYSFFRDQYECQCADCNIYVGGATAIVSSSFLILSSTVLSYFLSRYFVNNH